MGFMAAGLIHIGIDCVKYDLTFQKTPDLIVIVKRKNSLIIPMGLSFKHMNLSLG